jgi:hypothetical protein
MLESRRGVMEPRCVMDPRGSSGCPGSGGTALGRGAALAGDALGMRVPCGCSAGTSSAQSVDGVKETNNEDRAHFPCP